MLFIFVVLLHCCKSNPRAYSTMKMGEDISVKVRVAHSALKA